MGPAVVTPAIITPAIKCVNFQRVMDRLTEVPANLYIEEQLNECQSQIHRNGRLTR